MDAASAWLAAHWYLPFALLLVRCAAEAYVNLTGTPDPATTWGKVYAWIEKAGGIWSALAKDKGIPSPLSEDRIKAAHAIADNLVTVAKDIAAEAKAVMQAPKVLQPVKIAEAGVSLIPDAQRVAMIIETLKAMGMIVPRDATAAAPAVPAVPPAPAVEPAPAVGTVA